MTQLIIFKANWDTLNKANVHSIFPDGGASDILSQRLDYSDSAPPVQGERLTEYDDSQGYLSPTLYRQSPWVVRAVERFTAETGTEFVDAVVIATCDYSPLPTDENPWESSKIGGIAIDSFGGDEALYEAHRTPAGIVLD